MFHELGISSRHGDSHEVSQNGTLSRSINRSCRYCVSTAAPIGGGGLGLGRVAGANVSRPQCAMVVAVSCAMEPPGVLFHVSTATEY
jgi:hypothetical protein